MRNIPNIAFDAERDAVTIDLSPVPYLAGELTLSADELVDRGARNLRASGVGDGGPQRRPIVNVDTEDGIKHFTWSEAMDWALAKGHDDLASDLITRLSDWHKEASDEDEWAGGPEEYAETFHDEAMTETMADHVEDRDAQR